jgi:hypothetical protein
MYQYTRRLRVMKLSREYLIGVTCVTSLILEARRTRDIE